MPVARNKPFILSIVGRSDSGKTTLILKLLPELKKKGYRVAVAKHCPCGFDLDVEGKDSWKFTNAGAEGTFLSSAGSIAVIRPRPKAPEMKKKLQDYFPDFDLVLMEGYNEEGDTRKMQIMRKGIGGELLTQDTVAGYVSDMKLSTDKPVYRPDDVAGIISSIENLIEGADK